MKSYVTLTILIAFSLGACAAQQRPEARTVDVTGDATAPAATAPAGDQRAAASNTWYASRVIQVSLDNRDDAARAAVQELAGTEAIASILQKRGVSNDAAKFVSVRVIPRNEQRAVNLQIVVNLSGAPAGHPAIAREIADDLVQVLRQRLLEESQGTLAVQARQMQEQRNLAEVKLADIRQQLNALRHELRKATGRADASAERFRAELSDLEDHRQEIQLELESKAARMQALAANIAQISQKVEESVKNDPVTAELQKVVDARNRQAERLRTLVERGQASADEYEEAVAQAAEARARLLERRAEAAHDAGGDALNAWNREIMSLGVDTAELQARLERFNERLSNYQQVMDAVDELERLSMVQDDLEVMLQSSRDQLREMQRELASIRPPRAIVLESQDKPGSVPATRQPGDSGMGGAETDSQRQQEDQ